MAEIFKTVLGTIVPIWKGEYSSSVTYGKLNEVSSGSKKYRSKADNNLGNAVTNTTYWECIFDYTDVTDATEAANTAAASATEAASHANALQENLESGAVIPALASDLDISSASGAEYNQQSGTDTTGGSLSIKNVTAELVSVEGTDAGLAAANAKIYSRGFNAVVSTSGQTVTCQVVKGTWGSYGTASANNGYQFTQSDGTVLTPTSVLQNGSAVPTHVESGKTYYLPAASGTMVATFAGTVNTANVCCHLCWSNYRDTNNNYEAAWVNSVDLSSVVTSAGGTLRKADNGSGYVADSIVSGKWYRKVGQETMASLTWAMETITSGDSTSYRFTAPVTAMKSNGICQFVGTSQGAVASGQKLTIDSSSISTVAALQSALGSAYIKYELATVVSGTHSVSMTISRVDDFGIIYLGDGTVDTDMVIKYTTLWADTLKNLPNDLQNDGAVAANAIAALDARVKGIEDNIARGFSKLIVDDLVVRRNLSTYLIDDGTNDSALVVIRAYSPNFIPKYKGQRWIDTATGSRYTAINNSAITDFQVE